MPFSAPPLDPVGTMRHHAHAAIPAGWLVCDGSAISRTVYAALFAVLGGTYGIGDGVTTFNLPDMRGRSLVGVGAGPGLTNRILGAMGGEETHLLAIGELPSHAHPGSTGSGTGSGVTDTQGSHSHRPLKGVSEAGARSFHAWISDGGASQSYPAGTTNETGTEYIESSGAHSHNVTVSSLAVSVAVAAQGGGAGHNVMHPFTAVFCIIKY